jgi:hypothetical protein
MDWPDHSAHIQQRYFRTGEQTYLWINYTPADHLLTWCFTFMDLDMYHSISSHATVLCNEQGTYRVDGKDMLSRNHALSTVFGGHYAHFMAELYRDIA